MVEMAEEEEVTVGEGDVEVEVEVMEEEAVNRTFGYYFKRITAISNISHTLIRSRRFILNVLVFFHLLYGGVLAVSPFGSGSKMPAFPSSTK